MALMELTRSMVLPGDKKIVSKWIFTFNLLNCLLATFNANTDILISRFSANTIRLIVNTEDHLQSFIAFSGVVGKGKIKITVMMKSRAKIKGDIDGGPLGVQSIAGFGTWLCS